MRFSHLVDQARTIDIVAFTRNYPDPAIVSLDGAPMLETGETFDTPDRGISIRAFKRKPDGMPNTDTHDEMEEETMPSVAELTPPRPIPLDAEVHFLKKTGRNPFLQMITVGRSINNDIILPDKSISKVHAFFAHAPEGWTVHDQGSTNGTFVENDKVNIGGVPIREGMRVRLGSRFSYAFHTPESLFALLLGKRQL